MAELAEMVVSRASTVEAHIALKNQFVTSEIVFL